MVDKISSVILAIRTKLSLRTRARKAMLLALCPFVRIRVCWRTHKLRRKVQGGRPLRVAFLAMYATSNQDFGIFEMMLAEPECFDPFFIVNPDVARSVENRNYNYERTKRELTSKYGKERVLDGWVDGRMIDYSGRFDMMTTSNPYEGMAAREFKVSHWAIKGIPVFYTSYFYMGRCKVSVENLKMPVFNMFWRFFAENAYVMTLAKKYQMLKGRNGVLAGSTKMDDYSRVKSTEHKRKRIILAPHHSIGNVYPKGGGFLEYAEDMLRLIRNFRDVDFVFRPHPMLYENLRKNDYWGQEKTDSYWKNLQTEPNVIFSTQGDYLQEFADSDGMMHDCGSFAAEYLFTGKPCAYFYRADLEIDTLFTDLGRSCLTSHYSLHSYSDMEAFVSHVIVNGEDQKKKERIEFARNQLMYNYPHASEAIVAYIKKSLWGNKA